MAHRRTLDHFAHIYCVDFEFCAPPGERPHPICLVGREFRSGATIRLWEDDLARRPTPPYPTTGNVLFVAYYASAEINCHLALRWPVPTYVVDLFAEFRNLTNGLPVPCGAGLVGALAYFGLDSISALEKDDMRQLALRGGPWTAAERHALLDYCESDVVALAQLFPRMLPHIDVPRALLRGRYMVASARMEHTGVPLDTTALIPLRQHWGAIQEALIAQVDARYGVYDGRTFKQERFQQYLATQRIPWPHVALGALALDDATFKVMATRYPQLQPLRDVRVSLGWMRLADLAVGTDGRNRCLLSAFRARTSRNQPSNARFIFGPYGGYGFFCARTPGEVSRISTGANKSSASPQHYQATQRCWRRTPQATPTSALPSRPVLCHWTAPGRPTRRSGRSSKKLPSPCSMAWGRTPLRSALGNPFFRRELC